MKVSIAAVIAFALPLSGCGQSESNTPERSSTKAASPPAPSSNVDPYETLVPLLVEAIPKAVAATKPSSPICIVRLYFYDTSAPSTYLALVTVSANCRYEVVKTQGKDAPFYIWDSGEECGDGSVLFPPDNPVTTSDIQIAELFEQVYASLSEDGHEDENMVRFRDMLRDVSVTLNGIDWAEHCAVTDDFVVAPADGSMHFGGEFQEDMAHSIPADRIALLRSRHFLGPEESWDQLP